MRRNWIGIIGCLVSLSFSCGQQGQKAPQTAMSEYEAKIYEETLSVVKTMERRMADLSSASMEEVQEFLSDVEAVEFYNDTTGMSAAGRLDCEKLEKRIGILKRDAAEAAALRLQSMTIPVEVNDDCLLENTSTYPVYLERGDVLYYSVKLQKAGTVKIYNADARTLLKTHAQKAQVADSLVVDNKGIYLVEVNPGMTQYAAIDINYRMADHTHPVKKVLSEEESCGPRDFLAVATKGVEMRAAFDQPRKFTLRGQLKAAFSGSSRALVAVQIPSGTTDILYSIRISTSEQDRTNDGKFPDNMNATYKRVRFLGLPLYETSRSSGLLNTLLDDNRPIREEDAYCNMYVFRSQSQAKKFQDGTKKASELSYDVDYSTLGTQSCAQRIPAKGARTIYLAFENERIRYANYIWVEVMTAVPNTEYHHTRYYLE